uniref:Uncharacterized protein n=1 Tax=Aegilops tauschii subsp. strangulata TaxID=200361 RepID=A0A453M0B3_AEGTS
PNQDLPEATHTGLSPVGGMAKGKDLTGTSGDKSLSEVEHLLMRKTFTRKVSAYFVLLELPVFYSLRKEI